MTSTDKYTLIFDGNHFLHKTLHICKKIAAQENRTFNFFDDPEADKNLLLWKITQDFSSEMKKFSNIIENVVYAVDSSSWRKEYFPQEEIDSEDALKYKGTREYSEEFNWDGLYKTHEEFRDALEKSGITNVRIKGAEADDIVFAWSSLLNSKGKNSLIISGDNDLLQLVNHDNTNGTNTIYYHKSKQKIFAYQGFTDWLNQDQESVDIFNQPISMIDNAKDNLKKCLKAFEIEEINSEEFQFTKILVGDTGDNVASLYTIEATYKSGKKSGEKYYKRLTSTQAYKILNSFKEYNKDLTISESIFWNPEYISQICKLAKKICKIDFIDTKDLIKNYEDNRNLMILNSRALPNGIMTAMLENASKHSNKIISNDNMNILKKFDSVLEFTSYTSESKKKQNTSGFFGQFNI